MKVEVINDNRIQITISIDELSERNLSLKDIETDSKKARKLFLDLIEETNLQDDFLLEKAQVLVEASTDSNNEFIVTITKIEDFPDLSKFDILNSKEISQKSSYSEYYSYFNIFEFSNLDTVIDLSKHLKSEKCYVGKNCLLKYDNNYYLIFSENSIKNEKFLKTASIINEFCNNMYEKGISETSLREKSTIILQNLAIQKLSKI